LEYIGEHLLPGQLGHFFVILSFVSALLSVFAYVAATRAENAGKADAGQPSPWKRLGRMAFALHFMSVVVVSACLFFILTSKYYEYAYAQANIADDQLFRYTFAAFWKDQQGSFMLWSIWHSVLGLILIVRSGVWEGPVMAVIAGAETVLATMVLGVYFGTWRLGAGMFDLLRDTVDAPIFNQSDYLSKIQGAGLNPLLQNYWMTIHPPTLFLGFASTVVPFAFAIAGLWTRKHTAWLKPAMPWALFSGAILGTGIFMGAVWAYEALSFGGYWAWDPVENASLVPWLILVAGIHTHLIANATGRSIKATYAFYLASFLFVLYSTYLTRSGILGDTSAHAFTELGLSFQLVLFMSIFALIGFFLLLSRYKFVETKTQTSKGYSPHWQTALHIGVIVLTFFCVAYLLSSDINILQFLDANNPEKTIFISKAVLVILLLLALWFYFYFWRFFDDAEGAPAEESANTREFWMFIGALVLFFSATLMIGATSLPVFNKIIQYFQPDFVGAAIKDPVEHHNRYQLWIAVLMGLLSGAAQLLRYNERNWPVWRKQFAMSMLIATVIAAGLTWLNSMELRISAWQYFTMLFAGMFAVATNGIYLIKIIKGNLKASASSLSHIGFGLLILGILYTGLNKEWVSQNKFAMEGLIEGLGKDGTDRNVLLLRDAPMPIKHPWKATYFADTLERQTRTFSVRFDRIDTLGNPTGEQFAVQPNVMYDREFTKVVASNPSTKHYWNKDIFTLVSSLPKAELDKDFAKQQEDSVDYTTHLMALRDTVWLETYYVIFDGITRTPVHEDYTPHAGDLAFGLDYRIGKRIRDGEAEQKTTAVMYVRPGEGGFAIPAQVKKYQVRVKPKDEALEAIFKQEDALKYIPYRVGEGESFTHQGYTFKLKGVNKEPKHLAYEPQEGDIAVGGLIEVTDPRGAKSALEPLFIVRDGQPFGIKDEQMAEGLHIKFTNIDPQAGKLEFAVAKSDPRLLRLPFDIAEDVPSSDYIVMEAIIFPGINLVWIGCCMMLFGLFLGWLVRRSKRVA
jgi:cytochrome c-type biogenesis protein CcmF